MEHSETIFNDQVTHIVVWRISEWDEITDDIFETEANYRCFNDEEKAIKFAHKKLHNLKERAEREPISFTCHRGIIVGSVSVNE